MERDPFRFEAATGEHHFEWHHELEIRLRRTILSADAEQVEVLAFRRKVIKDPEAKEGIDVFPSHGKTFVWRRLRKRWGLFAGDKEVTKEHPHLVEQLQRRSGPALPEGALAAGRKWELGAPAFYGSEGCIKGGQLISSDGRAEPLIPYFEAHLAEAEREQYFPLGLTDPYAIQQLDWLQAIEQGRDPETSEIPVIIVTTKGMETDRVWGLRQGAKDFIVKPVNEKDLIDRIQNLLPS